MKKTEIFKKGLLLFGSFAIAYNTAECLHELGHAFAAWVTGGTVLGIYVHPFNWSYSRSVCDYPLFHIASGAGISSIAAVLIFILLIRWPKTWLLPLLLAGPITLINNGDYLLIDAVFKTGGDSCTLINLGVPSILIVIVAVILTLVGLFMAFVQLRKTGLLAGTFGQRLAILSMGIVTYLIISQIWNLIYDQAAFTEWTAYTFSGLVLTLIVSAIPIWNRKEEVPGRFRDVSWKPAIVINLLAIGIIVSLLTFQSTGFELNLETFSERPEDFPTVMTAPRGATYTSYSRSPKLNGHFQFFCYFPESITPDEIQRFISDTHITSGYTLIKDTPEDPNQLQTNLWIEESQVTHEIPYKTKSLTQTYYKIDSQFYHSYVTVTYMWKKDKFHTAWISQVVDKITSFEHLAVYFGQDQLEACFDGDQIQQLKELLQSPQVIDPNTTNSY